MNALVPIGANTLIPKNMDEALRLAEFMARARTVPKHLQDSPGDCLMVVELAMRWGMSPFAVAQGTSVISGKLMLEGKLVAAAVETSGAITGLFDYQWSGEGETRAIEVIATRRGETNPRSVTVKLKDARTNNELWRRQPDQQLAYHGVRVWARRWTPAVILGVYSREEMGPIIDGESVEVPDASDAHDAINATVPLKAAAADMPRPPKVSEPPPDKPRQQRQRGYREILDGLRIALRDAKTHEEVDAILCSGDVELGRRMFKDDAKKELEDIISAAMAKWWPREPEPDDELPDIEITGEANLAAG